MNEAIELHDSEVSGVIAVGTNVRIEFRPAYLHRREEEPGAIVGTGWLQDFDFVLTDASVIGMFEELPAYVFRGQISIDETTLKNWIPLPLVRSGSVRLKLEAGMNTVEVIGNSIAVIAIGEATYLEKVPF
jgi:hypothetical protein